MLTVNRNLGQWQVPGRADGQDRARAVRVHHQDDEQHVRRSGEGQLLHLLRRLHGMHGEEPFLLYKLASTRWVRSTLSIL